MKLPSLQDIEDYFLKHPLLLAFVEWMKTRSLPGFFNVPIWDVLVFVKNEAQRNDLFIRANAIAFSFFLSIFPALIALFTLLPYLHLFIFQHFQFMEDFNFTLRFEIKQIMPGDTGEDLVQFIQDITTNPRFGLLSMGFLMAIFFASNGMMALMYGFEKSYEKTFKYRSTLKKRAVALMLTVILGVMLIISTIMIIIGDLFTSMVVEWTKLDTLTESLLLISRWFIVLVIIYFGIAIIYRYGAATYKKFRFLSPGATLATVFSIISSVLFSYYLVQFNTYNKLYGSIGTIIALMLWIQINALILLIGFELNASIAVNRDLKKQIPDD